MNSSLLNCEVSHTRLRPVRHELRYPLYLYALDLAELPRLGRELPLFGHNRFRPAAIRDRDYLERGPGTIREKLLGHLRRNGWQEEPERIVLVTNARYLGHVFNPVSFYYCYRSSGELMTCAAEVNNTFGDRHLYVFPPGESDARDGFVLCRRLPKTFHVSPFNVVEGYYDCRFADIRERLDIHVDLFKDGEAVMTAALRGELEPLTAENHARTIRRNPITPWLTMPRIVWEALKLRRKGLRLNPSYLPTHPMSIRTRRLSWPQRLCMRRLERVFERFHTGRLQLDVQNVGSRSFGAADAQPAVTLHVRAPGFFTRVAAGGDTGFGEAYVDGEWDSPDVPALLKLLVANRDVLARGSLKPGPVATLLNRLRHTRRANTRRGSRRNIEEHYDLGNDFFRRFLDPGLTYSCALYSAPGESLEQAQRNKLDAIIDKAAISAEHHVLEIGCGWGSFAIRAAERTGCRVTGITISDQQHELARERVRQAGLEDRICIEKRDYRALQGRFDRIVSIEMLEAVGHRRLGAFFAACDRVLAPDGLLVLQVITIPDQRYAAYRGRGDWIQKHIFPGGVLPSLTAICRAATRNSSFIVEHLENIGAHYGRTLAEWRKRFEQDEELGKAWRGGSRFHRKWHYYFCYCEAGFATRTLEDLQLVLTRPNNLSLPNPP